MCTILPSESDERRCARRNAYHFLAVHVLLLEDAEHLGDFLLVVGQQGIRQVVLFFKTQLCLRGVGRDAQNHQSGFLQLAVGVAEPARFLWFSQACWPADRRTAPRSGRGTERARSGYQFWSGRVKAGAFELISIAHYLYRKSRDRAIAVLLVSLLLSEFSVRHNCATAPSIRGRNEGQPQSNKKPAKRGPRAIGCDRVSAQRRRAAGSDRAVDRRPLLRCQLLRRQSRAHGAAA